MQKIPSQLSKPTWGHPEPLMKGYSAWFGKRKRAKLFTAQSGVEASQACSLSARIPAAPPCPYVSGCSGPDACIIRCSWMMGQRPPSVWLASQFLKPLLSFFFFFFFSLFLHKKLVMFTIPLWYFWWCSFEYELYCYQDCQEKYQ